MRGFSERYGNHHRLGNRMGFTYRGFDRIRLLREWIGAGRRILDIGCRDGALTSGYAEGNSVIGVEVDIRALQIGRWVGLHPPSFANTLMWQCRKLR